MVEIFIDYEDEEIERLLREDSIDKKKAGRGASHRASRKKGFKGGVLLPLDYLKGKERRNYMFGETKLGIISFEEFKSIPMEQRKKTLQNLLIKHTRGEIAKAWGTTANNVDNYRRRLGLLSNTELNIHSTPQSERLKEAGMSKSIRTIASNFTINLIGNMDGAKLEKRLLDITGTLSPTNKYMVRLELVEEIEDHEV